MRSFVLSLVLALAISPAMSQEKSVGYNVGVCAKDGGFVGLHLEVNSTEVDVTAVNPGPDQVYTLEPPMIFKAVKDAPAAKYALGSRYVDEKTGAKFDLKFDKGQVDGTVVYKDGQQDHVFGAQGALNGLAADGYKLHDQCEREVSK